MSLDREGFIADFNEIIVDEETRQLVDMSIDMNQFRDIIERNGEVVNVQTY